jgi:hypothetical protein
MNYSLLRKAWDMCSPNGELLPNLEQIFHAFFSTENFAGKFPLQSVWKWDFSAEKKVTKNRFLVTLIHQTHPWAPERTQKGSTCSSCKLRSYTAGLPDFSWCMMPKPEKCTKCIQNVPNGHKISQISIKYSKWPQNIYTFSNLRLSKIYPNWDFWFENNPSGNPATPHQISLHVNLHCS